MAAQKSLVPSDRTSDGPSRTTARGRSGTIYNRTLLGLFDSTRRRLPRISRFSCALASLDEQYGAGSGLCKGGVAGRIRPRSAEVPQLRLAHPSVAAPCF